MKKRVSVTHFTTKIICKYLYITCDKKILFVKKYLSLLCVFTDFSVLLFAAMITDNDDDDDGDIMIAQCLLWRDEAWWRCRHCDAVLAYWPSDETGEGSSRPSSSEAGEGWSDENDDCKMTSGADDVDGWRSSIADNFSRPCGITSWLGVVAFAFSIH